VGEVPVGGFGKAQSIRMADKDRRQVRSGHRREEVRCLRVLGNTMYSSPDRATRAPICLCVFDTVLCSTVQCYLAAFYPSYPDQFCSVCSVRAILLQSAVQLHTRGFLLVPSRARVPEDGRPREAQRGPRFPTAIRRCCSGARTRLWLPSEPSTGCRSRSSD
jgi:hypothetical protein